MRRGLSRAGEHSVAKAMALPVLLLTFLVCAAGDQASTGKTGSRRGLLSTLCRRCAGSVARDCDRPARWLCP